MPGAQGRERVAEPGSARRESPAVGSHRRLAPTQPER